MTSKENNHSRDAKAGQPPEADKPVGPVSKNGKKRSRWLRWVLLAVVLLAALVGASPAIVSSGWGAGMVVAAVNARIVGQVKIADLSVSWSGPIRVGSLEIIDLDGRRVLQAGRVECPLGVWDLLRSPMRFGQVDFHADKAVMHLDANGVPSIVHALQSISPQEKPAAKLDIHGRIKASVDQVQIISHDARQYTLSDVAVQCDLAGADANVIASLRTLDGGSIRLEFTGSQLLGQGTAAGSATVATGEPINLEPLLAFIRGEKDIAGQVELAFTAEFHGGKLSADWKAAIAGLRSNELRDANVRPLDLDLTGELLAEPDKIAATTKLIGEGVSYQVDLTYNRAEGDTWPSVDELLGGLGGGKMVPLPDVKLDASGQIDLPRLAEATPTLLNLSDESEITGGVVKIHRLSIRGGANAALDADFRAEGLAVRTDETITRWAPVALTIAAKWTSDKGLTADGQMNCDFGRVDLAASWAGLDAKFDADLTSAHKYLAPFLKDAPTVMAGRVSGEMSLTTPAGQNTAGFDLTVAAEQITYATDEGLLALPAAKLQAHGNLHYDKFRLTAVEVASASVEIPDELSLTGSGRYDLNGGDWLSKIKVSRADLKRMGNTASSLAGWETLTQIAGLLTWQGRCESKAGELRVRGEGQVEGLSFADEAADPNQPPLHFAHNITIADEGSNIRIDRLHVYSDGISFETAGSVSQADGNNWQLDLDGNFTCDANLANGVLAVLVPEDDSNFTLIGPVGGQFDANGLYRTATDEQRPFRDLVVNASFKWTGAEAWQIPLGPAEFKASLADEQINIPLTEIDANGGTIRVAGEIDLRGPTPIYRLAGKQQILEGLEITPEMGQDLLTRFNPIFAEISDIEGRVSLQTEDLELPLGEAIKTSGTGRGHLDLREMKLRPSGLLPKLLSLDANRTGPLIPTIVNGVDFTIRDGRIHYDDFTIRYPGGLDLKFYGSVGLDANDELDLVVSVPLSVPLLEQLGVDGSLDYARVLSDVRIDIPVAGTRNAPRLDTARVDIKPLLEKAIKLLLLEQAGSILGGAGKDKTDGDQTEEIIKGVLDIFLKEAKGANDANKPRQE